MQPIYSPSPWLLSLPLPPLLLRPLPRLFGVVVCIYVLSCNPLSLSPFYLPTHDQSSRVALNSPTCQDTEDTEPEPEPDAAAAAAAAAAVVQVEPQPVASATAATPTATFLRHYPLLFQLVLCLCLCCIRTQRPSQPHPLAVLATHIYTL